jgi:hypothetical protein
LRIVHCAVQILKAPQLAATVDASGWMLCRGSRRLVGINADQQGTLRLRRGYCSSERENQGRESCNVHFHNCSTSNETENAVKLLSKGRIFLLYRLGIWLWNRNPIARAYAGVFIIACL